MEMHCYGYIATPPLCLLFITWLFAAMTTGVEDEDWQRYLDQRYYYINNFSEMLRRKTDDYHSKRDEYSNWLLNYRETEREDRRTHSEAEDEQFENTHELAETEREKHREHSLHHDSHHHKRSVKKRALQDVVQPAKEAKQFLNNHKRFKRR